jgi:bifunctional UDP-N-acetylglucosamine pyrophosphorylase/glucosamine-1-phosphate N-acetyltransferase
METLVDVVILAAGKGKRMHQAYPGIPKMLIPLCGTPMLQRVFDTVVASGIAARITVVVGPAVAKQVRATLAHRDVSYAVQEEPRGTGHAVLCAQPALAGAEHLLVLYADQPLYAPETLRSLVEKHVASDAAVTLLTVPLSDFREWRSSFADWGRIVRDANGAFVADVEAKDASARELAITEVNPGVYCFRAAWLWEQLPAVGCANAQGEYYLTDVLALAATHGARVATVPVSDPRETLGANTPEQLALLERVCLEKERA